MTTRIGESTKHHALQFGSPYFPTITRYKTRMKSRTTSCNTITLRLPSSLLPLTDLQSCDSADFRGAKSPEGERAEVQVVNG